MAVGLVVTVVTAGLLVMSRAGADTSRCAAFQRASAARADLVTGTGPDVLVIGDSYSVGLGTSAEASWPTRLPGRVHVAGFSGSGFSPQASECGAVAFADRAPRPLDAVDPDLVVVEGGLNDFDQPETAIRSGFERLMVQLGGRSVLVVGPVAAPSRADDVRAVDRLLARLARSWGVGYVSMLGADLPYLDDDLHLTPAGHEQFGDLVADALPAARRTGW